MKQHFIKITSIVFFISGFMMAGCVQKEAFSDVDGLNPIINLDSEQQHIHTAPGHDAVITGHFEDADGIAAIQLICPELFLDKTIDLIEIYKEPQTTYDLNYKYSIKRDELSERFLVKVIVKDIGNRTSECEIIISLDKDFEVPVFTLSVDKKLLVLKQDETRFKLKFKITDNMGLADVVINFENVEGFENRKIDLFGLKEYAFEEEIILPNEVNDYNLSIVARDAQDNETVINSVVSVAEMPDFDKMYLADVKTIEELNSDIFGVPMVIDHVGEYAYTAHYYCEKAGTEVRFIPQKSDFSPICFGLSKEDPDKLVEGYDDTDPIVLDHEGVYYQIDINVMEGTIEISTYSIEEAIDPIPHEYGSKSLDLWGDGSEFDYFFFGFTTTNPKDIQPFKQDSKNYHIFYSEPMEFIANTEVNFIIHNYHKDGWWNYCTWRSDTEEDPEIFGYYGNVVNPAWSELYGDNWVGDNWTRFTPKQTGNYKMILDAHLCRVKLISVK